MTLHDKMMKQAIELAKKSFAAGEIPVGAVVYNESGDVIAACHNTVEQGCDPTAHAEMQAIREACKNIGEKNLSNLYLAVTLEPCAMCAQAIAWARLKEVRFGAYDVKSGGTVNGAKIFAQSTCHHKPQVYGGFYEDECATLMKNFFETKRD